MRFDGVSKNVLRTSSDLSKLIIFVVFLCLLVLKVSSVYADETQAFQDEVNAEVADDDEYDDEEAQQLVNEESEEEEDIDEDEEQQEVEAALQNEQPEELPQQQPFVDLSNNPSSYSGDKSITIERASRSPKTTSKNDKETTDDRFVDIPCDPIVNLQVHREKRFDVLSKLAEEYVFDISMLESENVPISIEKNQPLSEVIDSITRNMNVFLNFQNIDSCKRLVSITVLNNQEWAGSGSGSGAAGAASRREELLRYKPIQIKTVDSIEVSQEEIEAEEKRHEEYRNRVESEGGALLNDTLESGYQLKNDFSVRGTSWKVQKENVGDMETYVQEVMKGERTPNVRGMSPEERKEYMRLRREYRGQQVETE